MEQRVENFIPTGIVNSNEDLDGKQLRRRLLSIDRSKTTQQPEI